MNDLPLSTLFIILFLLLIMSAIFSGSETGMMALNRYRLKALAQKGHRAAQRAQKLLAEPDRLLGVILLGNNFVNILASSIATIIAMRIAGEPGIAIGAGLLTLIVLIFSEVAPKTLAAMYPEKIAFPATLFLEPLLKLLSPLVMLVNFIANNFLKLLGIKLRKGDSGHLTPQELEAIIENTPQLPKQYREMLKSILRLEQVTVEDVIIPKADIYAIDVEQPLEKIIERIQKSPFTRIPLYRGSLDDDLIGILNIRKALPVLMQQNITLRDLIRIARPAYFVPNTTPLNIQLANFRKHRRRMALVVDEYGDLMGLLTMEDLLEEIVGELTLDKQGITNASDQVKVEADGSLLVDGGMFIRDLNKDYQTHLPTDGPKTLNGLIQERMETLPNEGTAIRIDDHVLEVVKRSRHAVEQVRIKRLNETEPEDSQDNTEHAQEHSSHAA